MSQVPKGLSADQFDPATELWPAVTEFRPSFRPHAAKALANIPDGLDAGALQVASGVWTMLTRSGAWIPFDPAGFNGHRSDANFFSRYGRGWSLGRATGDDGASENVYFEDMHGRPLGPPLGPPWEPFDLWFWPSEFNRLRSAYLAKHPPGDSGGGEPDAGGGAGGGGADPAAETNVLRARLAEAIKAREDAERRVLVRDATLEAERVAFVNLRNLLISVLVDADALSKAALAVAPREKGGVPARTLNRTGVALRSLAAETREKIS